MLHVNYRDDYHKFHDNFACNNRNMQYTLKPYRTSLIQGWPYPQGHNVTTIQMWLLLKVWCFQLRYCKHSTLKPQHHYNTLLVVYECSTVHTELEVLLYILCHAIYKHCNLITLIDRGSKCCPEWSERYTNWHARDQTDDGFIYGSIW